MKCRNCGESIDPRRVELGYDYCTREPCQRACVERVPLVRVTVNKAADQFVRAETPASTPERSYSAVASADVPPTVGIRRPATTSSRTKKRVPSELQVLRMAETELDRQLEEADGRFVAGEITAVEMKRRQNAAIGRFNARVAASNIRYRGLARPAV